jgi:hypothetical protein
LVLGVFGSVPTALAQTTPPAEALVARCDLPVLDLFNPLPGDVVQPGTYLISGLALDPMAQATTSGIDQVAFFLGDRDQGGTPLGTVSPNSGARSADFSLNVTLPAGDPGKPQALQAFARSALTGKETQLSLPIVVGSSGTALTASDAAANTVNTNPGVLPQTCTAPELALPTVSTAPSAPPTLGKPDTAPAPLFGVILGTVTRCEGGADEPVSMLTVTALGTSASGITDLDGMFAIPQVPAPGTYTVQVSDQGVTAQRMYVPVAPGETIDIGTLQMGADAFAGCGGGLPPNN